MQRLSIIGTMSLLSEKTASGTQRRTIPDALGRQLLSNLSIWRTQGLSLHDAEGDTLYLSAGSIGPDEQGYVLSALDVFALEPLRHCIHRKLEDGRRGLFLAARDPLGGCSGVAFAVIEGGIVDEARVVTPAIRALLQRFSMLLAPPVEKRQPAPAPASDADALANSALPEGAPIHARCYTRLQQGGGTRRYEVSVTPANAAYDASVIERVADWLAQHRQRYVAKPSSFAIAISPAAACDPDFAVRLEHCLTRIEIDEGMVQLVIPAAAWVAQPQRVLALLQTCERVHCHAILDDFALNEASLELLRCKAIRMIKLNAGLTNAAMEDRYSRALLSACTQIARVLGIHCVAKGVATATASRWMAKAGIDYVDPLNSSETAGPAATGEPAELRQVS
jgi:hypothetical protein